MEHTPRLSVNVSLSSRKSVLSGIPQVSVLSQLLFQMYVNDLPDTSWSSCRMLADDSKVFRDIDRENDLKCRQRDLVFLESWSDTGLLKLYPEKCKILMVGNLANILRDYPYSLMVVQLECVFEEKELDLMIDIYLIFDIHVSEKFQHARPRILYKASFESFVPEMNTW